MEHNQPLPPGNPAATTSIEDIFANPQRLQGLMPGELEGIWEAAQATGRWKVTTLGQGRARGAGFKIYEVNEAGAVTGKQIRWHPGGPRYGGEPYWKVTDNRTGSSIRIFPAPEGCTDDEGQRSL